MCPLSDVDIVVTDAGLPADQQKHVRDAGCQLIVAEADITANPANALAIKGRDVTITTPDGTADAYFVAPAGGKHPQDAVVAGAR